MNDLVSVVVVTYNSSETVIETLDSIYNQTYNKLELIVSDDHSCDNTVILVKNWLRLHHNRFQKTRLLVSRKRNGVTGNCNLGVSKVKGEYYQLIAGDDILYPQAIEKKTNYAKKHNSDLVFCKVDIFGKSFIRCFAMANTRDKGYKIFDAGHKTQCSTILKENFICGPSGGFVRKAYYDSVGGYDSRFPMIEDHPFLTKYIMSGKRVSIMDEVLVKYRMSDKSLCTSHQMKGVFSKSVRKFFFKERMWRLLKSGDYKTCKSHFVFYINEILGKSIIANRDRVCLDVLVDWVVKKENGVLLADYFHEREIKKIAIYGMGYLGSCFYYEMKNSDIEVMYCVDPDRTSSVKGVRLVTIEDMTEKADAIVVTSVFEFEAIKEKLENKFSNTEIVSLETVILESGDEFWF